MLTCWSQISNSATAVFSLCLNKPNKEKLNVEGQRSLRSDYGGWVRVSVLASASSLYAKLNLAAHIYQTKKKKTVSFCDMEAENLQIKVSSAQPQEKSFFFLYHKSSLKGNTCRMLPSISVCDVDTVSSTDSSPTWRRGSCIHNSRTHLNLTFPS